MKQAKSGEQKLKQEVAELERILAHVDAGGTLADWTGELPEGLEPLTTKPLLAVENGPDGIDLKLEAELADLSGGGGGRSFARAPRRSRRSCGG